MSENFSIAALVDDLEPVRPLSLGPIAAVIAVVLACAAALIIGVKGIRADILAGSPAPMFLIRAGLLLLLGVGSGWAALTLALPSVGARGEAWKMAIAAAALLPLAALVVVMTGRAGDAVANVQSGLTCLIYSLLAGSATAVPMLLWLRRGAPTSPERAGWLTGVSAGGLGAFAYGFYCPFNDLVYIGLWYGLAVAMCAVLGRLIVPPLVRW